MRSATERARELLQLLGESDGGPALEGIVAEKFRAYAHECINAAIEQEAQEAEKDSYSLAIPPVYTEFIGRQLLQAIRNERP